MFPIPWHDLNSFPAFSFYLQASPPDHGPFATSGQRPPTRPAQGKRAPSAALGLTSNPSTKPQRSETPPPPQKPPFNPDYAVG
jgi:hypothetical protein